MKPKPHSSLAAFALSLFGVGNSPIREKKMNQPPPKPLIQRGHKKFLVDGHVIYALNEHNARKKFKKEHLYYPAEAQIIK